MSGGERDGGGSVGGEKARDRSEKREGSQACGVD